MRRENMLIGGNQHLTSHMKAQKCGGECQHPKPPGEGECPGHGSDGVQIGGQDSRVEEGVHKKWLFMNYIAADCNLKEFQAANIDNQELVGSDKNTHVVAMIDVGDMSKTEEAGEGRKAGEAGEAGRPEQPSMIDWTGAKTYYVTKDNQMGKLNSPVVGDHGQINMTDPKTLTNFIVDSMKKFPSDHVALVMNDHGGGFTGAMSDDGSGQGSFTMPQIKQAIADAEKVTGKKIDILGFDACLMADVQAAHEFKDVANYLLASEETEGGPGWTYDNMMNDEGKPKEISNQMFKAVSMLQDAMEKKITVSPEEFCKIVVKVNEAHNNDIPTFSATDLTKMDGVAKAVDEFSKAIIETEEKPAVQSAIMNAEAYGGWMKPEPYCDMHDLHHIATLVNNGVSDEKLKKAAQSVQKAIGEAVIANETDQSQFPNSKGLSIFAPLGQKDGLGYGYNDLSFNKATQWQDAMKEIGKLPVPEQQSAEGDVPAELEQLIGQLGQLFGVEGGPATQNNTETPKFWPDGTAR